MPVVVVDFSGDTLIGTPPLTVNFTNLTSPPAIGIWDFGDGETATDWDVTHVYHSCGTYTVTLTAWATTTVKTGYVVVSDPSTASTFNTMVDAGITMITSNATLLGGITKCIERDEHPARANLSDFPYACIIPVVEDGDTVDLLMGGPECRHDFSMTVVAYYLATSSNETGLESDLRTYRNYGFDYLDLYAPSNWMGIGQIVDAKLDFGYWEAVDRVVHFWVCKWKMTAMF
jgi:hypothetical protein